jgi:hypothetical protein
MDLKKNQFGIVRLMILTTSVALVFAWIAHVRMPAVMAFGIGAYLSTIILWAIVRGPWLWSEFFRIQRVRKSRREEAMLDLERRRREESSRTTS